MREIHTVDRVTDSLYLIRETYCAGKGLTLPLILGEERAALLDSGLGVTDTLRSTAESVTGLPLINILSHGHPDHAGAAVLFDQVYMNERDRGETVWGLTKERRLKDLEAFSDQDEEVQRYCERHVVDCSGFTFENIDDGDIVDLGGKRLEILAMPGHTKGSLAILNRADGYVYTGDAVCPELMLTDGNRGSIEDSERGLERLVSLSDEIPDLVIYGAHFHDPLPLQMAVDLKDACRDILNGQTKEDSRTSFPFAEMNDPDIVLYRHEKGMVSVTYNAKVKTG